ncbi:MAG: TonB-dependent receptor [Sphingomonas sp.]|uniref:TonB-dependent receptor n=1 Tax=Sphingomonas sp. TaxID=28214 RepID=UPI0025D75F32|nr:TonB-dependent receptor [Sphingomonas sp.]MBQ1497228.1 TonB-dependent receptor [Sphingomonas sp.]
MELNVKHRLRLSALSGAAASALLLAPPAFAQQADTASIVAADEQDQSGGLGEIVVTAQRRETNLQKTPISIAVLNSAALENRHVQTLADLADGSVPGLRVAPFFSRTSALVIGIRGVGFLGDANQPAREQGVGVYIDGIYLGRAQGLGTALYDIERIEVLKGPQGTLFGRNTEGGAISIVTRKPSGEFHLNASAGIANFGGYETALHLDLPRAGNISLKFDGVIQKRGGTIDNPMAGQLDFNSHDRRGAHVAALWEPSDKFSALWQFDVSHDESSPYYLQLLRKGSLPLAPIVKLQPERAKAGNVGVPLQPSVGDTTGMSLHLDWKLGDSIRARSITSYRTLTQSQYDNGSAILSVFAPNGNFARYSIANFGQRQFSQEVQLLGELPRLSFVAGAFYYSEHVGDNAFAPNTLKFNADGTDYSVLPAPVSATRFPDRASIARTNSAAVFGQFTYTPALLGDRLHLTLGGRYSHDKKTGELDKVNGALPVVNGVSAVVPMRVTSDRFDPLVNLSLDVADGVMLYGKWSTGYKSAGANSRSLTYRGFGPEAVSEFEGGVKASFLDNHARLNLAAYTGTYKDVQIDFNAVIPGSNRGTLETTNTAGKGRISGFEAELTVMPVANLTLSGTYTRQHIRLPEAPNPFVAGNPLVPVYPIFAPKNSASGSIDYRLPMGAATLVAHLDGNYASSQYSSTSDPTKSDPSFIVNGRLALTDIALDEGAARLELSLWARNLLDRQYLYLRNTSAALGTYGIFNDPRTYGLTGTVRF